MIDCQDIVFSYPRESFSLRIPHLVVEKGGNAALIGPSGCGKTTLLNLISGTLLPQEGQLLVDGTDLKSLSKSERQEFRIKRIGLVPQNFELLDYLTVRENILLPFRISRALTLSPEKEQFCETLAERTGIAPHLEKFPDQLSQGERQRAAICRGLVTSPDLILADEPTGNLDPENQDSVVQLLLEESHRIEATFLMITHEHGLVDQFDRTIDVFALRKGEGV